MKQPSSFARLGQLVGWDQVQTRRERIAALGDEDLIEAIKALGNPAVLQPDEVLSELIAEFDRRGLERRFEAKPDSTTH